MLAFFFKSDFSSYFLHYCRRSYHEQQNPPSEEIYAAYFRAKKEAGETDKDMWMIYLALRKVAFHAFNQRLRDYITVKQWLTYSSRERKPSTRHDPGICPHCGEVSTYRKSSIISRPFIILDPIQRLVL